MDRKAYNFDGVEYGLHVFEDSVLHCEKRGFSLLEVMVALAILAGGLVVLLQIQARSIQTMIIKKP